MKARRLGGACGAGMKGRVIAAAVMQPARDEGVRLNRHRPRRQSSGQPCAARRYHALSPRLRKISLRRSGATLWQVGSAGAKALTVDRARRGARLRTRAA